VITGAALRKYGRSGKRKDRTISLTLYLSPLAGFNSGKYLCGEFR